MTTFSTPTEMLVWPEGAAEPRAEKCDGFDVLATWYDGWRNRAEIQPLNYVRDENGHRLFLAPMATAGGSYAISRSHPLCPYF